MEIKEQLDKLGTAFEEFKKTNDLRLKEISEKGQASSATETKLAKVESDIEKLEKSIEKMTAALNRTAQESTETKEKGNAKYKAAMQEFMRKGTPINPEVFPQEYKDMSVQVDQDGGFLVSPEMASEIETKVFESSPIRQLASQQNISTDSLEILQDLDEAGSGWVGETQTRSNTDTPQFNKIVIPVHELYALPKATQKLLDDAAINLEAWLGAKVSEKFQRDEATAFVSGNGVMKPKGILNYGAGDGFGLVQRQETATNSAITADVLIDTQSLLKEAYQNNASWLMNRLMVGYVRKLKDGISGNYLWQPGLMQGQPNQLLGRPVYFAADLPSSVVAATDTFIYGDIRAGYQVVDRIGIRVLRDPYTSKGSVLFYTTKRVGGGVKNFEAIKVLKVKA